MKYICIHGHFYQPPRENAWLEEIEVQDSAAPFHNWNERINFECYAPNAAARILDDERLITDIINNYSNISFNFGPTLLSWLEKADYITYQNILKADRESIERFNGHGSAIAQVYSHLIMPLANRRDKETQVLWGIKDFEARFARKPEGMWLSETAVDVETLEVLAENDIKYTILAPRQAKAVRRLGEDHWNEVHEHSIDPKLPYLCKLPSGKEIVLFFYDGVISQEIAFKGLLNNGKNFAARLMGVFEHNSEDAQLVHVATDGETYGHHHRFGEMALADCLQTIESHPDYELINYGAFLEKHPPKFEVQIHENSSWSCVHGVERWRTNCGCNSGKPGYHQLWRAPLREALDWLRDELGKWFETKGQEYLKSPWDARNHYIEVILDRQKSNIGAFVQKHAKAGLDPEDTTTILRLLEVQRHCLLMYTSCGWFFDELSGIETIQILQYSLRAIAHANRINSKNFQSEFMGILESAPSNEFEDGVEVMKEKVLPTQVDLKKVAMHYAAASLFEKEPENMELFNYSASSTSFNRIIEGNFRLATGMATVQSKVTLSKKHFCFAVVYLGQQQIFGNLSLNMYEKIFLSMKKTLEKHFKGTNIAEVIAHMQVYFGHEQFTFAQLFRDEKMKILRQIVVRSLKQAEADFRDFYNYNYQLMAAMQKNSLPIPEAFKGVVHYILNLDMNRFFEQETLDNRELIRIKEELRKWNVKLSDKATIKLVASERIFKELNKIKGGEFDKVNLKKLTKTLAALNSMDLELDIWKSQNLFFSILQKVKSKEYLFENTKQEELFYKLGLLLEVA